MYRTTKFSQTPSYWDRFLVQLLNSDKKPKFCYDADVLKDCLLNILFFFFLFALLCSQSLHADDQISRIKESEHRNVAPVQDCNLLPNCSSRLRNVCQSFDLFADVLVWTARQSGSENWAQTIGPGKSFLALHSVHFPWDVGLRVGFDYGMKHDQWDTLLAYTWFRTKGTDRISTPYQINPSFNANFYVNNASGGGFNGPLYHNGAIQWTISFNMFDWELGRKYWASSALSLRPFVGLKGGWIHQTTNTQWLNPDIANPSSFGTAKEDIKNNFWGVGPSGGLNTKWNLGTVRKHIFSLFGDFSGAMLLGRWTFSDIYTNAVPIVVTIINPTVYGAACMFRGFMGFEWDASFNNEQVYFSMKMGYESQFWMDQLQIYSFDIGLQNLELTLQGATVDFTFDF